jgi:hypothetical protein
VSAVRRGRSKGVTVDWDLIGGLALAVLFLLVVCGASIAAGAVR